MKKSKQAFIHSVIALLVCVSMFVGTTFAWFTDEVTSMNNIIQSGNLDVELEYFDGKDWVEVKQDTNVFDENALWEPGHTEVVYLKIRNAGSLALKYQLGVNVSSETLGTNEYGNSFKLSDYIKMGAIAGQQTVFADRQAARNAVTTSGTLSSGYVTYGKMEAGAADQYIALVVYMPEEVDNVANYKTGTTPPQINLGITLLATQMTHENDSFGPDYDEGAKHPHGNIDFSSTESVEGKVENGALTENVTVGDPNGEVYAEVPAGVQMEDGADALTLVVQAMENGQADIQLEAGESKQAFNIHMEGVAEGNTVPMLITVENMFSPNLNSTSVAMYHVENGRTVQMTAVALADLDEHNEFYYDVATGNVILCVATFSEYVTVENDYNEWKGNENTAWYNEKDTEFILYTADELAGFGVLVDGGNSFAGKTIKLGADIDLDAYQKDENGEYITDEEGNRIRISFNPIGFGYDYAGYNTGDVAGKVFKGTFDGQGYTISNLYVNGWDIGISYSNSGGGLFASVCDATIKNLTMQNAQIIMECVEQGVIAGLAQGTCTFENINIYGCSVANYQRATGGVVGEVSPQYDASGNVLDSEHTFTNINIDSTTVIGSLWGDFDAPVGGVIGARWDDSDTTKIVMENVTVACRLDVYNDVTSTYQWYAYRRAGMLIGNTDKVDPNNAHVAYANFLECKVDGEGNPTVFVYYGNWVNYHYCQFTNQDNTWCNNYPWVRVEAGENCSAYSNPRYGQPVVGGVTINSDDHTCTGEHKMELPFNQLYGGGQGVYGAESHPGVTTKNYAYSIQYINDSKLLAETFVESNNSAFVIANDQNAGAAEELVKTWATENGYTEVTFGGWMNAGSTLLTEIASGNTENIKLYPRFDDLYTASFVDQNGNILAWCLFNATDTSKLDDTKTLAESSLLLDEGFSLDYWEVHYKDPTSGEIKTAKYSEYNFARQDGDANSVYDVTIYPVFKYNGDVNLIPIDEDNDGDTDYYQVGGYGADTGEQELVEIPGSVNGIPVTTINADAFSSYDDLYAVRIPATIESIDKQAFSADDGYKLNGEQRDTVTLYFELDPQNPTKWKDAFDLYNQKVYTGILKESWDNMMGDGSRVFFLDESGDVDLSKGYWELYKYFEWSALDNKFTWVYHDPSTCGVYSQTSKCSCGKTSGDKTTYNDTTRPDSGYWYYDDDKTMPIYKTDGTKYIYDENGAITNP